jgi:hypothetical protein
MRTTREGFHTSGMRTIGGKQKHSLSKFSIFRAESDRTSDKEFKQELLLELLPFSSF